MELAIALATAGVLALIISAAIIPVVIMVSHRRQWYDIPNERKIHNNPIPRLGGIGIFFGLLLSAIAVPLLLPLLSPAAWPVGYSFHIVPVFVAFCLIHGMGLADDFQNLHALLKFLLQIVAASLVTVGGFTISVVRIPGLAAFSLGIFAYPITVLWIVAISNAINLMDGIDGLAGGIAAISALSLGVMSLLQGRATPALVAFCLMGAVIGFLIFNFPPRACSWGTRGAFSWVSSSPSFPSWSPRARPQSAACSPRRPCSSFPSSIRCRPSSGASARSVPIYSPDKQHIHHKLLALDMKETSILLIIYGSCVYFSAGAVASLYLTGAWRRCCSS